MAESEQTERSRGAAEGKCIPWQPAHHLLVVFTAFIPCCFSKDMQKNTSAQTDEAANASTNQSRRDAHTEYVLRFTHRGKGAQGLGVERQGHGACELPWPAPRHWQTNQRTHTSVTQLAAPRHMKNARGELQRTHLFTQHGPGVSLPRDTTLREYVF